MDYVPKISRETAIAYSGTFKKINHNPLLTSFSNRALSDQYFGQDSHHQEFRQQICEFLRNNEENYKYFVEDDQSFEHHVECMSHDATYGGNMELAAFAKMKEVDIKVYQPGMMYVCIRMDRRFFIDNDVDISLMVKNPMKTMKIYKCYILRTCVMVEPVLYGTKSFVKNSYHSWEHYSSVRNIDGPFSGPPEIKVKKNSHGIRQ